MAGLFRVNFYPRDWLIGTDGLSLEERGLYIELVARIYDRGAPLPHDERELGRMAGCDIRTFRRVLAALIDKGKITETDGCLSNARCDAELAKSHNHRVASAKGGSRKPKHTSLELPGDFGRTSARSSGEVRTGKKQNQPLNGKQVVVKSQESVEESESRRVADSQLPRDDAADHILVGKRIMEIIEHGRDLHPTLRLNFSIVQKWLRGGWHPEQDIYPAIELVVSRQGPDWWPRGLGYFEGAIADYRAERLKPLPPGVANGRKAAFDKHHPDYIAERARLAEEARRDALTGAALRRLRPGPDSDDTGGAGSGEPSCKAAAASFG